MARQGTSFHKQGYALLGPGVDTPLLGDSVKVQHFALGKYSFPNSGAKHVPHIQWLPHPLLPFEVYRSSRFLGTTM